MAPGGTKMATFDWNVVELSSWQHLNRLDELIILVYLKIDFGLQVTELWAKTYTPKYGASPILSRK